MKSGTMGLGSGVDLSDTHIIVGRDSLSLCIGEIAIWEFFEVAGTTSM
jgi:hypothetical protein